MKQPKALYLLFFVELWERFSFYGMRGILIYFMLHGLHLTEEQSYDIKGAYGILVYISPLFGGFLADKLLGTKKSIMIGAFVMMLGHLTMLIDNVQTFFSGLALVALGNGFFKPNISSSVGQLYSSNDPRKDTAFTIFYMGVNIGAFLQFLCPLVSKEYNNYHIGFSLAGFGMALGLIIFMFLKDKLLVNIGDSPNEALLNKRYFGISVYQIIWISTILLIPVYMYLLQHKFVLDVILYSVGVLFFIYLFYQAYKRNSLERNRIYAYVVLFFYSMMFWAFFEQGDTSLGLYIEKNLDRHILGYEVPPGVFQSVNPGYIIVFAMLVSSIWSFLAERKKDLNIPLKLGLGVILNGIGFLVFYLSKDAANAQGLVPLYFFLGAYILITLGELFLSPIGLSMVTKIAPPDMTSLMMGGWMLSIAFAHSLSAEIAKLTTKKGGEAMVGLEALNSYCGVYYKIGVIAILAGLVLVVFSKILAKMMALKDSSAPSH
ncbi:MAG: oligopeptide:H+ symporter [Cytophagales bacterium]